MCRSKVHKDNENYFNCLISAGLDYPARMSSKNDGAGGKHVGNDLMSALRARGWTE
jgi:hypothetical protein